jgi:sec-independent protein translocase protein TatA
MGTVGVPEMIVIFVVALVLFGPKKLPELGRTIGKAITEFRRATSDLKSTFEREMQSLERESESLKEITHSTAAEIHHETSYEYPYYDAYGTDHHDSPDHHTSTVSASEVPDAESHGTTETAHATPAKTDEPAAEATPAIEGTVPRGATPEHSHQV